MLTRSLSFVFLTASLCWLAGCASPTAPATGVTGAQSTGPTDPDPAAMPFPKLEKGMTAAVIRQKLGAPVEIQPMASREGKAEVWIYKFEKNLGMTQVAAGTREMQVMTVGSGGVGMTGVQDPVYTLAEKKSEITLSLLMFNDRLEVQKAKVESTLEHH
jgi:hypothetical protein